MATITFPRCTAIRNLCVVCQQPSDDNQGLVLELVGYIHPNCSNNSYEIVTDISFPDEDEDPEPDPTTPAPAALTSPELCPDCAGLHDPEDLCPDCQVICNKWDSDHAPDYDRLYERHLALWKYGLVAA